MRRAWRLEMWWNQAPVWPTWSTQRLCSKWTPQDCGHVYSSLCSSHLEWVKLSLLFKMCLARFRLKLKQLKNLPVLGWLSVLWSWVPDDRFGWQLAPLLEAPEGSVHSCHVRLHVCTGPTHDHQRRSLHLPTHVRLSAVYVLKKFRITTWLSICTLQFFDFEHST